MAGINLLPARFPVAVTTGNDVTITLDVNDALGRLHLVRQDGRGSDCRAHHGHGPGRHRDQ